MSVQCGKLVSLILSERFGPIVEKVGMFLYGHGPTPLVYIKKYTDLPLSKVKESLCILIKYCVVSYKPNKNENIANYKLESERVLLMLRYPKYINLIKKKFGEEAEIILEELFLKGYGTASELILKVFARLKEHCESNVSLAMVKEHFNSLVIAKYLFRISYSQDEVPVPILNFDEKVKFVLPEINLQQLNLISSNVAPLSSTSDINVFWTVNFDRFHQDMRDKLITTAVSKKFDDNAGEIMKVLLQQMYIRTEPWSDISNPIPIREVKDFFEKQKKNQEIVVYFDQYVAIIEQDTHKIIKKFSEASGGSFQIYMKEIIINLIWETVELIVLEKFDSKAARIFHLVKSKKYIEPEQIQQLAMIPAKEAKRLTYQLLEENFLELQELKKSGVVSGPNKSFTLFYINLDQVVRMVLEMCYKSLYNVMTRRNYDKIANKRIIDKKQRVDTIVLGMKTQGANEDQIGDIEEMITPPEKEHLDKISKQMKKLNMVELEIDETIFLLDLYVQYNKLYST